MELLELQLLLKLLLKLLVVFSTSCDPLLLLLDFFLREPIGYFLIFSLLRMVLNLFDDLLLGPVGLLDPEEVMLGLFQALLDDAPRQALGLVPLHGAIVHDHLVEQHVQKQLLVANLHVLVDLALLLGVLQEILGDAQPETALRAYRVLLERELLPAPVAGETVAEFALANLD